MSYELVVTSQTRLRRITILSCDSPSRKLYLYFPRINESAKLPMSVGFYSIFGLSLKAQKIGFSTNGLTSYFVGTN